MIARIAFAIICLGLSVATEGHAREAVREKTQTLYQKCTGSGTTNRLLCLAYLRGVADMMGVMAAVKEQGLPSGPFREVLQPFSMCNDDAVTIGQIRLAFVRWARAHRSQWNTDRAIGARAALREAWPCP
jgi:Ssp1 endopeptidase immunity protein Rap1a